MSLKRKFKQASKKLCALALASTLAMAMVGCEHDDDEEKEKPVYKIGSAVNDDPEIVVRGSVPTREVLKNTGVEIIVVHIDGEDLLEGNRYSFEEKGYSLYVDGSIDGAEVTVNGGQLAVSHAVYARSKVRVNVPAHAGYIEYPCIIDGCNETCTEWTDSVPYAPYNAYAKKFDPALVVSFYISKDADVEVTKGAAIKEGILFIRGSELYKTSGAEEEQTEKTTISEEQPLSSNYNSKETVLVFAQREPVIRKENSIRSKSLKLS